MSIGTTPRPIRDKWSPEMDAVLMKHMKEGQSLDGTAYLMGISKASVRHRFDRLRRRAEDQQ